MNRNSSAPQGMLYLGDTIIHVENAINPYDMYDQFIFTISSETVILDQNNSTIPLEEIQPGQLVRVEHAMFQTLSIPPQSPAYRVQIL